jgi:hypothetical protein
MLHQKTMVMRANAPLESQVENGLILCDLETGDILSLNPTARAIWEAIAEPATVAAICETLQHRFIVEENECLLDVTAALSEFERRRFVRITPPAEL